MLLHKVSNQLFLSFPANITIFALVYSKYGTIVKRIIADRKTKVLQMNSDLMHPSSHWFTSDNTNS